MCGSRPPAACPDDPAIHQSVLAYASDMTLLDTSLIPHGRTVFEPEIQPASLDHAMWFHRPFRADEWLLYAQDTPERRRRPRPLARPHLQAGRDADRLGRAGRPHPRAPTLRSPAYNILHAYRLFSRPNPCCLEKRQRLSRHGRARLGTLLA